MVSKIGVANGGKVQVFQPVQIEVPINWGKPKFHFGQRVCASKTYRLGKDFVGQIDTIFYQEPEWGYAIELDGDDNVLETVLESEIEAID